MGNYEKLDKNQQEVCNFIAKESLLTSLKIIRDIRFNVHSMNLAILNGIRCFGFKKPFFNKVCKYITDESQKHHLEFGEDEIEKINGRLTDLNEARIIKLYNFLSTQNLEDSQIIKNFFGLSELVHLASNSEVNYFYAYIPLEIRDVATPYFRFNISFDLLFQVLFTIGVKVEIDGRELCEDTPHLIGVNSRIDNPKDPTKWEILPAPDSIGKSEFQETLENLRDKIGNENNIDDFIASINENQKTEILNLNDIEKKLLESTVEFLTGLAMENK